MLFLDGRFTIFVALGETKSDVCEFKRIVFSHSDFCCFCNFHILRISNDRSKMNRSDLVASNISSDSSFDNQLFKLQAADPYE